ncbi:hypothetical protein GCM10020258_53820 [Sphingomonas yabuuchiae]
MTSPGSSTRVYAGAPHLRNLTHGDRNALPGGGNVDVGGREAERDGKLLLGDRQLEAALVLGLPSRWALRFRHNRTRPTERAGNGAAAAASRIRGQAPSFTLGKETSYG